MKSIVILFAAFGLTAGAAAAQAATSATYAGHELAGQAHVTLDQALKIALTARPGKVTDRELEKEAGGSGLRWSFDISSQKKAYEVGVDAQTGKVLENKAEGKHPD